jgi:hypothetical protein
MLDVVVPRVEALCSTTSLVNDQDILTLLRSKDLLEEMQTSHGIQICSLGTCSSATSSVTTTPELEPETTNQFKIRPFHWNRRVASWCRSLLWGHVFVMGRAPLGIWQGTAIQLFQVKSSTLSESN